MTLPTPTALRTFLDRCAGAGLLAWVFDAHGALIARAGEGQPWAGSAPLAHFARAMAEPGASHAQTPDGTWFQALAPEGAAIRVVVAALSPAFGHSRLFSQACAASGQALTDAWAQLRSLPHFDADSARAILGAASAWSNDLFRLEEQEAAISGFTTQLSQAFDNIACLYRLGRAMHNPAHPAEFLKEVCERLRKATDFSWVAARFLDDGHHAETLANSFFINGVIANDLAGVLAQTENAARAVEPGGPARVLTGLPILAPELGQQVLAQPLARNIARRGALLAGGKQGPDPAVNSWDIQLFEAASGFIASYLENVALYDDQHRLFLGTLQALTSAIDAKDRYTCGHSERVAHVSAQLARQLGMGEEQVERIRIAGLVHDVGKIGVPESVLTKQGKLTDAEFDAIKRHPAIGHGILRDIPQLADILPGVLHHHERWDGRGYPSGLCAQGIPLQARIIAVADTFDAMSSTRSYRPAMSRDQTLAEIRRCSGSQFDPALVPEFLKLDLAEYDALVARHAANEPAAHIGGQTQTQAEAA